MALDTLLATFPRERTWLLPALQAVQRAERYLSPDALEAVAAHLRVPKSEVWGVASHYPELRLTRPGRRLVRVCTGVSCRVRGGRELLAACAERLGVAAGVTAADGSVTLEEIDCAFACAVAPIVEVDHRSRGRVAPGDLDRILADAAVHAAPWAGAVPGPPPVAPGMPAERLAALVREAERRRRPLTRLVVGVGSCGLAVGAADTFEALVAEVERRKLPAAVVAAGCNGMCWAAPVVEVLREGRPRLTAGPVAASDVGAFLDALARETIPAIGEALLARQNRVLLERCGLTDPSDIADALRHGSYATLARALGEGGPERVLEEVRAAGLTGRGGAYFQTAVKWAACRAATGTPKYVVVNGEEGEPGIFKDRHLMEGDPHRLLEALLLAAYSAGASRAVVYVHGEADLSAECLRTALAQARQWGLVGPRILGADFSLDVELRRGAGGFVLGEETALLESIEGRRAMPRTRPPFPVESGLWGKPTVINNVETLCAVPPIVAEGGAWFASLGRGGGTKVLGPPGHAGGPGLVELELGCTLRTLMEDLGGGSSTGRPIRAVVLGGPSGSIVHPRHFDEPLVPRGPVNPGTGGVVVLDERASVKDAVVTLLACNPRASCGRCDPCRGGRAEHV